MAIPGEPHEGNNKIPKGWLLLFGLVILFLLSYIVSYTPAISGWSYYAKFRKEMAEATPTAPAQINSDRYLGNKAAIAEGQTIFLANCAPCHKADATGAIGPNLTGKLKYGSATVNTYESIAKGRGTGMPPFEQQLGQDRIEKIIAFLTTMKK